MRINFLKYSKTKKKNISFLSSNAITTIFGLEKLQSLLMSAVKIFSKKIIQSKDIGLERALGRHFDYKLIFLFLRKNRG